MQHSTGIRNGQIRPSFVSRIPPRVSVSTSNRARLRVTTGSVGTRLEPRVSLEIGGGDFRKCDSTRLCSDGEQKDIGKLLEDGRTDSIMPLVCTHCSIMGAADWKLGSSSSLSLPSSHGFDFQAFSLSLSLSLHSLRASFRS